MIQSVIHLVRMKTNGSLTYFSMCALNGMCPISDTVFFSLMFSIQSTTKGTLSEYSRDRAFTITHNDNEGVTFSGRVSELGDECVVGWFYRQ